MSTSRKKVDTWCYTVTDVMEREYRKRAEDDEDVERIPTVGEKKVEISVVMIKDTEEDKTPPFALKKIEFEVACSLPKFTITGPDIELLKRAAWSELDKHYEIEWFDYYLVEVRPARIYSGVGEGIEFSYDTVWKGITWDGKELLKEYFRHSGDRGEPYRIKPWPGRFMTKGGDVVACIPRDDRTEEALKDFGKRIALIRDKMAEFLTPENIMHTLANLSGVALLSEPPSDEKPVEATPPQPSIAP